MPQAKQNDGSKRGFSRRSVLKGLGAGAVAAAVAPMVLIADDKKSVTTGTGANTYEWIDSFVKLPETHKFGNTHGIQVDSQSRIFVHSQGATPDSVCIFDNDGKFVKSWGKEYTGGAHGLQLVKEGNQEFLYLAATGQHFCVKTTLDGEVVWKIEFPKDAAVYEGKPNGYVPTNIAVAKNGDVYVADGYGKSVLHRYNAKGEYQNTFGAKGNGEGQMSCPHGIFIDTRSGAEEILVADRSNERMQWFSLDGKFLRIAKPELRHPCHFDEREGVLLCPGLHARVSLIDKENKLIVALGDNEDPKKRAKNGLPKAEWKDGQFIAPHGACFDKAGNILVAEWVTPGRVTKLKKV